MQGKLAWAMKVSVQSVCGPEPLSRLAFVRSLTMSLGKKMQNEVRRALHKRSALAILGIWVFMSV